MKCNGCGTHMILDRQESTETASTYWHQCPLCSKVRLTSTLNSKVSNSMLARAEAENEAAHHTLNAPSTSANSDLVMPISPES